MKTLTKDRFDGGANDNPYDNISTNEFGNSKGFDFLSLVRRVLPVRRMDADTAGTGIGNLLVGSDGKYYGLGIDPLGTANSLILYHKDTFNSGWTVNQFGGLGSSAWNYDLFMEYPDNGGGRNIIAAYGGGIGVVCKEDTNGVTVAQHALTYTSVTQGCVHTKDDVAYVPYTTASGTFIASNNAGTWNDVALTLPSFLIVTQVVPFGNYLAIFCAPRGAYNLGANGKAVAQGGTAGAFKTVCFLWNRDASLVTIDDSIDWGTGIVQVANVLDGLLVTVAVTAAIGGSVQDRSSIAVKSYATGGVPKLEKEITTKKETTTSPTVSLNPFVNFVYRNRLYFSGEVIGGSTSPSHIGVWCFGKSKQSGRYAVYLERGATQNDSESKVLACAAVGDFFSMVYNSPGSMAISVNSSVFSNAFSFPSYVETEVNPMMASDDFSRKKKLKSAGCAFLPLTSSQQVTLEYRVDGGPWKVLAAGYTLPTDVSGDDTASMLIRSVDTNGDSLFDGTFYEFRAQTLGGGELVSVFYTYYLVETN